MSRRGFSLVEVVIAVGIFALTIVGVIGLLAPTSKNITDVADSDAASRVLSVIQAQLQTAGFDTVKAALNAGTMPTFYASKDGSKMGVNDAAVWNSSSEEKFFTFTMVRNTSLSPSGNDSTAGFLAFTLILKWPAYAPNGTAVDAAQQSTLVVPSAITR